MNTKKNGISKIFLGFWIVLVFLHCSSLNSMAKCPTRMGSVFAPDQFLVIARGGSVTKFPENTLPAFQEALDVDGANSLKVDLSLTKDGKIVLWHDWNPNSPSALIRQEKDELVGKFKPFSPSNSSWRKNVNQLTLVELREHYGYLDKITHTKSDAKIPTFQGLMEWATKQDKLKLVLLKLKIPADERHLTPTLLEEIRRTIGSMNSTLQFIILTPHKEILSLVKSQFDEFLFSYDREIPPAGVINYHRFTTVPTAMDYKNSFASLGFPAHTHLVDPSGPDPWLIYKYILTLDFKIRDNYKKSSSRYVKIISWTFNDEKKMRCLINLGVDGIVTDKPELLRRIALDMGKVLD
jgi:glycerophosphoryl diester phosphodiesterase